MKKRQGQVALSWTLQASLADWAPYRRLGDPFRTVYITQIFLSLLLEGIGQERPPWEGEGVAASVF